MADYSTLGLRVLPYTITSVEGGFAPRGRRGSGFPIGPIGTGRAAATAEVGATVKRDVGGEDREPRTPTTSAPSAPSATPATSSLSGYVDAIKDYISDRAEAYFGFPEAVNPLTGTVRATGVSPHIQAMMPGFFGPLMELGYELNMANLSDIASKSQVNKDYSTGLMGNQLVGVKPTADTIGGRIAGLFGFDIEGYTLSGNIGGFTNVDQDAYEDALITSLLYNQPTAYGPARAVAMGLDPQVTYSQVENKYNVATLLGIDPFGPNPSLATSGIFQGFTVGGEGRPDPTRPGSIVGSYDPFGNWSPVTSGMSGYAFSNMPAGTTKTKLEKAGFSFFERPGGQFEVYSPDIGWGKGGGKGSPHDNTATSQSNQGSSSVGAYSDKSGGQGTGSGGKTGGSGSGDVSGATGTDTSGWGGPDDLKFGGRVNYAPGGNVTNGFVNKDPDSVTEQESIADNRHTSVKEGSFIVNQPTNEKYEGMLDSLVAKAQKKVKKLKDAPMVDVALSDGERHIEPEVVAEIEKMKGKGFLDKLNNKGKPEVKRRQAKYGGGVGLNEGGFLEQGMEVQDVGDDIPMQDYAPVSDELISKLSKFAKRKPQRGQIKEFIKGLSDEDKLTVLFLTETQSTTDPIESMEAIGEVVQNRMASDYYDFKDIKTLDDALLKQTRRGAFHFSGLEPSTLFARAKEVKKGLAGKGLAKAAAAAQNVLDPETEGSRKLPVGTVFYTRKDAPSQWMRESKDLEFSTELGGHEFYRTFITREFP